MCTLYKDQTRKNLGIYQNNINANYFNEKLCIDILGPLDISSFSHDENTEKIYLLCTVDVFSRLCKIHLLSRLTSQATIIGCKGWVKQYGNPNLIITDQGKQFISKNFQQFCKNNNIIHHLIPVASPESNGIVERLNGKILAALRTAQRESLDNALTIVENSINHTVHRNLGLTPFQLAFKKDIYGASVEDAQLKATIVQENKGKIENRKKMEKLTLKHQTPLSTNDLVYLKYKRATKMDPYWYGPFKIATVKNNTLKIFTETGTEWVSCRNVKRAVEGEKEVDIVTRMLQFKDCMIEPSCKENTTLVMGSKHPEHRQ